MALAKRTTVQAEESKELNRIAEDLQEALRQITEARHSLSKEEGNEKKQLADRIAAFSNQIRAASGKEAQETNQLDATVGSKARGFEAQLTQIVSRRDVDLSRALKEYQDQIVNSHLQRHRISTAHIPGIGSELKRRLAEAGYVSAGDIGTRNARVQDVGQKRWDALNTWRANLDNDIRWREAPKALPTFREAAIQQRYESQIRQLEQSLSQERVRFALGSDGIKKKYAVQIRALEQQRTTEEIEVKRLMPIVEAKFDEQRKVLSAKETNAREQSDRAVDQCKRKSRDAVGEVSSEAEKLGSGFATDMEKFNTELAAAAKLVREASWRRDRASQICDAHAPLTFRRYSMRLLHRL